MNTMYCSIFCLLLGISYVSSASIANTTTPHHTTSTHSSTITGVASSTEAHPSTTTTHIPSTTQHTSTTQNHSSTSTPVASTQHPSALVQPILVQSHSTQSPTSLAPTFSRTPRSLQIAEPAGSAEQTSPAVVTNSVTSPTSETQVISAPESHLPNSTPLLTMPESPENNLPSQSAADSIMSVVSSADLSTCACQLPGTPTCEVILPAPTFMGIVCLPTQQYCCKRAATPSLPPVSSLPPQIQEMIPGALGQLTDGVPVSAGVAETAAPATMSPVPIMASPALAPAAGAYLPAQQISFLSSPAQSIKTAPAPVASAAAVSPQLPTVPATGDLQIAASHHDSTIQHGGTFSNNQCPCLEAQLCPAEYVDTSIYPEACPTSTVAVRCCSPTPSLQNTQYGPQYQVPTNQPSSNPLDGLPNPIKGVQDFISSLTGQGSQQQQQQAYLQQQQQAYQQQQQQGYQQQQPGYYQVQPQQNDPFSFLPKLPKLF